MTEPAHASDCVGHNRIVKVDLTKDQQISLFCELGVLSSEISRLQNLLGPNSDLSLTEEDWHKIIGLRDFVDDDIAEIMDIIENHLTE